MGRRFVQWVVRHVVKGGAALPVDACLFFAGIFSCFAVFISVVSRAEQALQF